MTTSRPMVSDDISSFLKTRTKPNTASFIGSSRQAAMYLDPPKRTLGNAGWMNWANGALRAQGKAMIDLGNFAVSGSRTDQYAVDDAIATGAALIFVDGPVNNFAQAYPTAGTTVATAFSDLKAIIKKINAAGSTAVYIWERGAGNFSATQEGYLNDFNVLMADYVAYGDDLRGPPDVLVLDPTPYTVTSSNAAGISLKSSQDAIHDNVEAGKLLGFAFAPKIAPYLREIPGHNFSTIRAHKSGVGVRGMNPNPGMTGSAAATGVGNTGNAPTSFTTAKSGLVTCAYSIQATAADANGNTFGNEVKLIATATGVGTCALYISLDRTQIVPGDFIRGGCEIDVEAGATGFQGVYGDLEWFPTTGGTTPTYDMYPSTIDLDLGGYSNFRLEPPPLLIGAFTGNAYTNFAVRLMFNAAGSATVIVRKIWANRSTH